MQAGVDEMCGLQHRMAMVAYRIRARNAEAGDAFIDEIVPIMEGYHGPDREERLIDTIRQLRSRPEVERAAASHAARKPSVGLMLQQYAMPLLATQIADLTICSIDFQRAVLHIRQHLDLFNGPVPYTLQMLDKTFSDNLSTENRTAIEANLEEAYRNAGIQAEIIMRAIADIQRRYGKRELKLVGLFRRTNIGRYLIGRRS